MPPVISYQLDSQRPVHSPRPSQAAGRTKREAQRSDSGSKPSPGFRSNHPISLPNSNRHGDREQHPTSSLATKPLNISHQTHSYSSRGLPTVLQTPANFEPLLQAISLAQEESHAIQGASPFWGQNDQQCRGIPFEFQSLNAAYRSAMQAYDTQSDGHADRMVEPAHRPFSRLSLFTSCETCFTSSPCLDHTLLSGAAASGFYLAERSMAMGHTAGAFVASVWTNGAFMIDPLLQLVTTTLKNLLHLQDDPDVSSLPIPLHQPHESVMTPLVQYDEVRTYSSVTLVSFTL